MTPAVFVRYSVPPVDIAMHYCCQDESAVSTEISRLKLQLQTSLSEHGVFEMKIGQLTDDVKRMEAERDEVIDGR